MQVFIIGSPLETAKSLDNLRLNKQIIECYQILDALNGAKAWSNHPVVLQYRGYEDWLKLYTKVLEEYRNGNYSVAETIDSVIVPPPFHTEEFLNQMKRRLYTKNPQHYSQWYNFGMSFVNFYFIDGVMRKYIDGKQIE
jgi:hypothetical protein